MAIENISDTARWVAEYRAMETDRPDAVFRDPYARRLAGPKGAEIVKTMKRGRAMAWPMIVRTAVFDEMILDRIRAGADGVLNLAAGLDTRPWRLDLPPSLRWVDVDLPGILEHKTRELRDEPTRCHYEPVALDLRDVEQRRALVARLGAACRTVVVLTEGLLVYLEPAEVATLARDLHAVPSIRWWILDIASPQLVAFLNKRWGKSLAAGNSPFRFAPAESTDFFAPHGWREVTFRNPGDDARRLNREMPGAWFFRLLRPFQSRKKRQAYERFAGNVLLERG